jgi:hypothetical protein
MRSIRLVGFFSVSRHSFVFWAIHSLLISRADSKNEREPEPRERSSIRCDGWQNNVLGISNDSGVRWDEDSKWGAGGKLIPHRRYPPPPSSTKTKTKSLREGDFRGRSFNAWRQTTSIASSAGIHLNFLFFFPVRQCPNSSRVRSVEKENQISTLAEMLVTDFFPFPVRQCPNSSRVRVRPTADVCSESITLPIYEGAGFRA